MEIDSRIYIAGHTGMVGSAIVRNLEQKGYCKLITMDRRDLDLNNQAQVKHFFHNVKPEYVFLAAAKVGGILANSNYPAEFIYNNLSIQCNVIHQAFLNGVKKLLFLGSSCIYPKNAPQPMKEEYLLTGLLEPTNEPYAVAKIAGIKMCQAYNKQYGTNYISVMPTNLFGPNDNYDLETSHVLAALIRKFHEAKIGNRPYVEVWGTGKPLREFLHVDDLASACLLLMKDYEENEIINIGTGREIAISELAELVKAVIGYKGEIRFDSSKPDGTPRKLLDISKQNKLGFRPMYDLHKGIEMVYRGLIQNAGENNKALFCN